MTYSVRPKLLNEIYFNLDISRYPKLRDRAGDSRLLDPEAPSKRAPYARLNTSLGLGYAAHILLRDSPSAKAIYLKASGGVRLAFSDQALEQESYHQDYIHPSAFQLEGGLGLRAVLGPVLSVVLSANGRAFFDTEANLFNLYLAPQVGLHLKIPTFQEGSDADESQTNELGDWDLSILAGTTSSLEGLRLGLGLAYQF